MTRLRLAWHHQQVITTASPAGLGFNPFSAIKSGVTTVARGAVRVASNPNVQRAAAAGAQAYAPAQYAQAQMYADRARGILRPPPGAPPPPMPMMLPPPDMDQGAPRPVKSNGMMLAALVGAGLIVVLLMTKK